ncbi:MAG: class I SAM-dependent methyltransferase [Streptomycetales bacterium]
MSTFVSLRFDQFAYFDTVLDHPDWSGKRVLDYGGNVGNMLVDPDCAIEPANYWSLDVSWDAIAEGRRRHPDAHFVFYDRHSCQYNPSGAPGLPVPDMATTFDVIVSLSVITHMSQTQALEVVRDLRGHLAPGGVMAMTFMDPNWVPPAGWVRPNYGPGLSNLRWRLDKARANDPTVDVEAVARRVEADSDRISWVVLLNDAELILDHDDATRAENQPHESYMGFCTPAHMRTLLSHALIRPPDPPERYHCAIING